MAARKKTTPRKQKRENYFLVTAQLPGDDRPLSLTFDEWSKRTGLPRGTIASRIHRGWTESDAVSTPAVRGAPRPDKEGGKHG